MTTSFCKTLLPALLFWILSALPGSYAEADPGTLGFELGGTEITRLELNGLLESIFIHEIELYNPLMGKNKSYHGFAIRDILDHVYQERWQSSEYSDIAFRALDGYEAIASLATLSEAGGYLAFEDVHWPDGWEPVGRRKADPGPYFLVWTEKHQTTENAYPWPWQVSALNLLRFEDQYPRVVPANASPDSPAAAGFQIFRSRCLRCHAMDRQGGKIGPDLNAPQSIVSYRSEEMIKAFIRQPSKFRYSHMPDHTDLDDNDLDNLYNYFLYQDTHRKP